MEATLEQVHLNEVWTPEQNWEVNDVESLTEEERRKVDGKSILGIVKGQFFVPNGTSRNKRFYSRTLWEDVLNRKQVREKMENGLMLGTIGHEDKAVCEKDISSGKISHRITKLWIDPSGKGMGEAYILNTPTGRNLWVHLKSGTKLSVSSRGSGKLVEGKMSYGVPEVDKKSFTLETFDFVINPGFLEAKPTLKESMNTEGKNVMSEELVKDLHESREILQEDKEILLEENTDLKLQINDLQNKLHSLAESYVKYDVLEVLSESQLYNLIDLVEAGLHENVKDLEKYQELGTPEEISEAFLRLKPVLEQYKASGEPAEISEALNIYEQIGTPEEISELVGTYEDILEQYEALGTPAEIAYAFQLAEQVNEQLVEIQEEEAEIELDESVKYYSGQYGLSMEAVRTILEKHDEDEAVDLFEDLTGSAGSQSAQSFDLNEDYSDDYEVRSSLSESLERRSGAVSVWQNMIKG
jgi:hypothetical protein